MGTKTQRIALKFGMPVIGLEENHKPIDELAQTKKKVFFFWDALMSVPVAGQPATPCQRFGSLTVGHPAGYHAGQAHAGSPAASRNWTWFCSLQMD